jgi:hypothetical protein
MLLMLRPAALALALGMAACSTGSGAPSDNLPSSSPQVTAAGTPFDKFASVAPMPVQHDAPELEALLPDEMDGVAMEKESHTGTGMGLTEDDVRLARFGKHPNDYASAQAQPATPPLFLVGGERLDGVPGEELLAVILEQMPEAEVTQVEMAGREVTQVIYGAWPVWYLPQGELLYGFAADPERTAAAIELVD